MRKIVSSGSTLIGEADRATLDTDRIKYHGLPEGASAAGVRSLLAIGFFLPEVVSHKYVYYDKHICDG